MAGPFYCYHGGSNGDGLSWANAKTTALAGLTLPAAGETLYLAHDHIETNSSAPLVLTGAGTATNPVLMLCANRGGTEPPVSADLVHTPSAQILTTGAANNLTISGQLICEGIIFQAGDAGNAASLFIAATSGAQRFKNCALRLNTVATASIIRVGNTSTTKTFLDNVTVQFGHTAQSFSCNGGFLHWRNTPNALSGAVLPSVFLSLNAAGYMRFDGVDLSALGSGKTVIGALSTASLVEMANCKFNDLVTLHTSPFAGPAPDCKLIRCSGSTNYKFARFNYYGDETTEISITRVGGSSDGTQPFSKKIVTTVNAKVLAPFEALPIEFWNDVEDVSRTITIEGVWNGGGGSPPDNDDIWIEVDYLANASDPNSAMVSSAKSDILATATPYSTSTASWGGGTTKFKMQVAFTPAQKGPGVVRVKAALPSATFYVCGLPTIVNT